MHRLARTTHVRCRLSSPFWLLASGDWLLLHPMAKKSSCKCKAPECEECPEWIFTFADLVMLMMGFFVILWVTKPAPTKTVDGAVDEKWLEVVAKIREAFKYVPDPESKDPVDMHM